MAKPKQRRKRRPASPAQQRAYQSGYYQGFRTMAEIVRHACDLRDVPAAERAVTDQLLNRILGSISAAMHEIEGCGRATPRH